MPDWLTELGEQVAPYLAARHEAGGGVVDEAWRLDVREHKLTRVMQAYVAAEQEVQRIKAATQLHHDQRGDNRCWLDDLKLYHDVLGNYPDPYVTALPSEIDMIESCQRYIRQRQCPGVVGRYPMPGDMTIAQLTTEAERLSRERDQANDVLRIVQEGLARKNQEIDGVRKEAVQLKADVARKQILKEFAEREAARAAAKADLASAELAISRAEVEAMKAKLAEYRDYEDATITETSELEGFVRELRDALAHLEACDPYVMVRSEKDLIAKVDAFLSGDGMPDKPNGVTP